MVRQGTVKWFSNVKGFGFIEDVDGADIFVHHSAIVEEGFRTLKGGQVVEFELHAGPKGPHAQQVRKVQSKAEALSA